MDAFERRSDELARAIASQVLAAMQAYPAYGQPGMARQLSQQAREHIRLIAQMTRTGRPPNGQELEFARQVGRRRATAAPLAAVMRGYRVGTRVMCEWIASEAGSDPNDLRAALLLTSRCFEYSRAVSAAVAAGYVQQSEGLQSPGTNVNMRPGPSGVVVAAEPTRAAAPSAPLTIDGAALGQISVASHGSPELGRVLLIPAMADGSFNETYFARLSPRERDLVALVARGLTNKEIAVRLGISLHTTK
jgi:hypothetical protein